MKIIIEFIWIFILWKVFGVFFKENIIYLFEELKDKIDLWFYLFDNKKVGFCLLLL